MKKQNLISPVLTVTLLLCCCTSLASAATVVTEYQWNPNGDWFADPPQPPIPGRGTIDLIPKTDNPSHVPVNNIYNYHTTAPINDAAFAPFGPSGFAGPGLNLIIQNRNKPLNGPSGTTNAGTLALRGGAGRLSMRTDSAEGGGGSSVLGWSSAANTSLNGVDFALAIGPSSGTGGIADWEDGMRLAIQDTSDHWYLSNWSSNGKVPLGSTDPAISGTVSGVHLINLTNETWAPFTPATPSSGALVSFDAGSATFALFSGEVKAFGFYVQDIASELPGGATEFRMRMNGFKVVSNPVAIPEPSFALLMSLAGVAGLGLRRRRS